MRTNLPRAVRALRLRRGWRQADLAARAGCTRQAVSRLECGGAGGLKLATLDAIAHALGASLDLTLRWEGALLDRTLDAAHARIVEIVVAQLNALGWETRSRSASTTTATAAGSTSSPTTAQAARC